MNQTQKQRAQKAIKPTMLKAGSQVNWTSTASSVPVKKQGVVLAFVPAGTSWRELIAKVPTRLLKGINLESTYHRAGAHISERDRYLVSVNKIGGKVPPRGNLLYTPLAGSFAGKGK